MRWIAPTLEDAILQHDGESVQVRQNTFLFPKKNEIYSAILEANDRFNALVDR